MTRNTDLDLLRDSASSPGDWVVDVPTVELALAEELLVKALKDAERYRWLRSQTFGFSHDEENRGICASRWGDWPYDTDEGHAAVMDAAIDSAMAHYATKS